jgi:CBS domain-containing protein
MLAKLEAAADAAHLPPRTTVAEIMMLEVATCSPTDSTELAAQLMWEHDCGCLPVVDDKRRPVAMITDRDICMAAYLQGKPLSEIPVSFAMSSRLFDVQVHDPIPAAERIMRQSGARRLPVVNRDGVLVGLLSIDDIMACAHVEHVVEGDGLGNAELVRTAAALGHAHRP